MSVLAGNSLILHFPDRGALLDELRRLIYSGHVLIHGWYVAGCWRRMKVPWRVAVYPQVARPNGVLLQDVRRCNHQAGHSLTRCIQECMSGHVILLCSSGLILPIEFRCRLNRRLRGATPPPGRRSAARRRPTPAHNHSARALPPDRRFQGSSVPWRHTSAKLPRWLLFLFSSRIGPWRDWRSRLDLGCVLAREHLTHGTFDVNRHPPLLSRSCAIYS